jgi:endonuclease I
MQVFSDISDAVVTTHMKIFRYVSWASNGVSDKLLDPLYREINSNLFELSTSITELSQRRGFVAQRKSKPARAHCQMGKMQGPR